MTKKIKRISQKDKNYLKFRKESLIDMQDLVYQREKFNREIRKLNKEMVAWDRAFVR